MLFGELVGVGKRSESLPGKGMAARVEARDCDSEPESGNMSHLKTIR